ncbi:conserved hypothetical protein ['Nostoc azollae' 0708]|jgi:hypothetical protein|uniref:Uncharacterized protein n=1 Tax=Nostoc azollae (strain 0708) TaxID=551115 RepID=D7DX56_NOSA0|nr:conserved hypothetical protein ['Nostoc azollae' 0708]
MVFKGKHKKKSPISSILKISSSLCALCGAILLASKTIISGYGFIFLAISSSQLLVASILLKDKIRIFLLVASLYLLIVLEFTDGY